MRSVLQSYSTARYVAQYEYHMHEGALALLSPSDAADVLRAEVRRQAQLTEARLSARLEGELMLADTRHRTAEAIRKAINGRILEFSGHPGF